MIRMLMLLTMTVACASLALPLLAFGQATDSQKLRALL